MSQYGCSPYNFYAGINKDEVTMIKGVPMAKDMVHLGQLMGLLMRRLPTPGLSEGLCTLGRFLVLNAQFPIAK